MMGLDFEIQNSGSFFGGEAGFGREWWGGNVYLSAFYRER
jgi:hypothetical protein